MKKEIIRRIIFLILTLCTFTTIFGFSSQNGTESKSVSKTVMRKIVDIYPKTKKINEKDKEKIVEKSQPFIRKTAHFTIYMIAGIMIMELFNTYNLKWNKKLIITFIIGFTYAISDELHQGITGGGRTPRIFDVFIDSLGVLTGIAIVLERVYYAKRIKSCRKNKNV